MAHVEVRFNTEIEQSTMVDGDNFYVADGVFYIYNEKELKFISPINQVRYAKLKK